MYWSINSAYEDLDGVYYAGVENWRNHTYPDGTRLHRRLVNKYVPEAKEIVKKHSKLRRERNSPRFHI